MKQDQNTHESDRGSWTQDRGIHRELNTRASSATLRLPRQRPFDFLDNRRERTDVSIAQGLLKEENLNHPRRRSPFNASPVSYTRQYLNGVDGQSDGPEHGIDQERSRKNRNTSNTWTDSSLGTEVEDEEDRTEFVNEYNRLAEKHGVGKLVPDGYETVDVDTVTVTGKHGSWIMRKLLRRTSSMQTMKVKTDKQIRHKRSISDFSTRLRMKKEPLKDKSLKELVDICGRSLLYLPSDYAAASLSLPTCLRATAHYIVQHGVAARGIFRIPGSNSSVLTLYNYYATVDECANAICGTVRAPTLPEHLNYEVHDVASVFKKFLSGLPGGILQGSTNLFEALIAIQSHLNSDPEWTRTKQSKVRARLIALAIGSVRSRLQRELICAVSGLLCMIGRAAELAPREDDRGRPLPTSGLMGYGALGVIFGPLLLGETLDTYEMRFAHGGHIVFPAASSVPPQKDLGKAASHKRKSIDELSYAASRFDKVKVANGIMEMLIVHWRDVVRHMRGLSILKTSRDHDHGLIMARRRSQLRPYASELFTLRKPPEWSTEDSSIRRVPRTPSPLAITPLQRHISQSEPGAVNQHNESLQIRKQRCRPIPPAVPKLSGSKSMGTLSPMEEEPAIEDQSGKSPSQNLFTQPLQVSRPPFRNRLPSNPALREAAEQLKSPPASDKNVGARTETSSLLAEVARELRSDAQKRVSAQLDVDEAKIYIAELPGRPEDETVQRFKPLKQPNEHGTSSLVIDPPSHLEEAAREELNKIPPQFDLQTPDESTNKDPGLGEDPFHKLTVENVSRVRLVPKQSPRSSARDFFEKADQALNISNTAGGVQDWVTLGSPGKSVLSPRTNAPTQVEPLSHAEPSPVRAQEQSESVVTAKTTPTNQARQYFERADRERTSTSAERQGREAFISDKINIGSLRPSNARTTSPALQREPESKNYSSTRFHAASSESPLRSEVQRSSTHKTIEVAQLGAVHQVQIENSNQRTHKPQSDTIENVHQTSSPLPGLEKSKHKDLAKIAENLQPPVRPQVLLRRPQAVVASRIRGLVTSDPGSQKPQHPGFHAAPSKVRNLAAVEKRKAEESAKSPAVLVKGLSDGPSREKDLNSLSVLANSTQRQAQVGTQIKANDPGYESSESQLSSATIRRPAASQKESADPKGLISAHGAGLPEVERRTQEGAVEEAPEASNPRNRRSSENQKSDASNVTVILSPKRMAESTEQPISLSKRSLDRTSNNSQKTITSPPQQVVQILNERPPLAVAGSVGGVENASNGSTTISLEQTTSQAPFSEISPRPGETMNDAQTPEKQPSPRAVGGPAGSVMALAAIFNNSEQSSPVDSPVKRVKPRGVVRHSLFQPADRLVSNYTKSSPSPAKSTQSERSDIRAMRNPLPVDRRPNLHSRRTPQKEISPLYRMPRNGTVNNPGSPASLLSSKMPHVSLKRSAFDGNGSLVSPDPRTPSPHRPNFRLPDYHSPGIPESLGSRTPSSVGTVLPHPVEPPVDQHVPFTRPPSTPRRLAGDREAFRVTTPSGNAALYEQIRKLQKQLDAAADELVQYKRQVESRGNLQDLGTLSEQLRESKREARSWRARAELAERRLAILERIKGKVEYGPDDGTLDGEDKLNSDPSTTAIFNENKSRNGQGGKSRVIGEATDFATQSTDTEVWVRGGTATIIRGDGGDEDSMLTGSPDHACEEKMVIGDMTAGMRSTSGSNFGEVCGFIDKRV